MREKARVNLKEEEEGGGGLERGVFGSLLNLNLNSVRAIHFDDYILRDRIGSRCVSPIRSSYN